MKKIWLWIIWILIVIYIWYWVVLTSFSVNVTAKEQCYNETFECYRKCWTEKNRRSCLLFKQWYWKWIFLWWYSFVEAKIKDISNNEEFSEYWLLQWPNGTITLEDFEKEWNIIKDSEVDNWTGWKICSETPETACVPVILKENEILVTPHEYNEFIAEETDLTLLEPYYTDLKTFRKVTWLKEASPEYVEWELPGTYIFDAYTKFYKTKEEREAMLKEKIENQTIEEPAVNTDNIDTEEERKERCKDEAMKQFNEIIPDWEFVNLVWEGLEKETRDESWRLTIIHRNLRIVYNQDWNEWFWPWLCETNFVEWNQNIIFSQSYMNI